MFGSGGRYADARASGEPGAKALHPAGGRLRNLEFRPREFGTRQFRRPGRGRRGQCRGRSSRGRARIRRRGLEHWSRSFGRAPWQISTVDGAGTTARAGQHEAEDRDAGHDEQGNDDQDGDEHRDILSGMAGSTERARLTGRG